MEKYNNSHNEGHSSGHSAEPCTIIKIGGNATESIVDIVLRDMRSLPYRWIMLHGGGPQVSRISRHYGIEPTFIHGIRQTSPAEMDIIDMGLAGLMNTAILRAALVQGIDAVGLSGVDSGLFIAEKISDNNHTGKVVRINPKILSCLLENNYLPIISSVSATATGEGVNVNADDATLALASLMQPEKLIFISDTEGVLGHWNAQGARKRIPVLDRKTAQEMIQTKVIRNGMVPKVENALQSLHDGTGEVIIGSIEKSGDLNALLNQQRGTRIIA